MSRSTALQHVQNALAAVTKRESRSLGEDARLFEDLALDSTTIIELLLALEDEVAIDIEPDELGAGVFESVGSLTDYVESKLVPDPAP
ncbi:phosphopantetheine-binding protein [Lentzea alba]|uniref:acyl carrier protein n=1 Tax=Lentzea alba TaxID=2714351 RepID=UPI0039BF2E29